MTPRKVIIIAGVVVAAGLVAVVITARDDRPQSIAPSAARSARPGPAATEIPVTDLRLELLQSRRAGLSEPERNPFRFQARPTPAAATRAPARVTPVAPAPPRDAVPAGPAGPPPIPLRFIGLVDAPTQAGRVAIVSDGRGNVFYGKEGAIIEGRYRILKISPDTVDLSYLDGRGRQTVRLSGQ